MSEGVDEPRCPECGYTEWDKVINCDHHLCKGPGAPPPEADREIAEAVGKAVEHLQETGVGNWAYVVEVWFKHYGDQPVQRE